QSLTRSRLEQRCHVERSIVWADLNGWIAGIRRVDRLQNSSNVIQNYDSELLVWVLEHGVVLYPIRPAQNGLIYRRWYHEGLRECAQARPEGIRKRVEPTGNWRLGRGGTGRVHGPVVHLPAVGTYGGNRPSRKRARFKVTIGENVGPGGRR